MFQLALALGRTVGELLDSISWGELLEWGAYYKLEPFGEWRADVRSAHVASVIANVNRDPKKRAEPFTINDFMLKFDRPSQVEEVPEEKQGAVVSPGVIAWLFTQGSKRAN